MFTRRRKRKRRSSRYERNYAKEYSKSMGMMDRILIFVGILLLVFIVIMLWIFCQYGAIPDTLCTCVFAACTGELGITGMIQASKNKYQDRKWLKDDQKEMVSEGTMVDPEDGIG